MKNRIQQHLWAACVAIVLMSSGLQSPAQAHFDNEKVSFDYPEGWRAGKWGNQQQTVRMDDKSGNTIVLIDFNASLPRDLNKLSQVMENVAFSEATDVLSGGLSIEQGCSGALPTEISGRQAMMCRSLLKHATGIRISMAYMGIPLQDTTCLMVFVSENSKTEADELARAIELLVNTIQFKATPPPANYSSAIGPPPFGATQPPGATPGRNSPISRPSLSPAPSVDDVWKTYSSPDFSFQYPSSWQVYADENKKVAGATDSSAHGFDIRFVPGAQNQADTLNQCASVDKMLDYVYHSQYEPFGTSTTSYPFTTVTHDDYQPGRLGGQSTTVTVVRQEKWQNPVSQLHTIEVVPRADGMYVVTFWRSGEGLWASESIRKRIAQSVVFKSRALDKNAYCNYLGK